MKNIPTSRVDRSVIPSQRLQLLTHGHVRMQRPPAISTNQACQNVAALSDLI